MERLIDIEDGLNVVIAEVEFRERRARVAEGLGIDCDGVAGSEVGDIDTEALRGVVILSELIPRLGPATFREDEDEMAVERGFGGGDGDDDSLCLEGLGSAKENCEEKRNKGSQAELPLEKVSASIVDWPFVRGASAANSKASHPELN